MTSSDQPLVTLVLLAYRQEAYIRRAVEGAFSQTWQPLEIILSDDCSPDGTFEIMREMAEAYPGPHRVVLNRNQTNQGLARHFSAVLEMARGELAVLAAGDDISLPERTALSVAPLIEDDRLSFTEVAHSTFAVDAELPALLGAAGRLTAGGTAQPTRINLEAYLERSAPSLSGCARTIRLRSVRQFGPLRPSCPTEDTPSILRLLLSGDGLLLPRVGMLRRLHGENLSSPASLRRMNLDEIGRQYQDDIETALEIGLLDERSAKKLSRSFRQIIGKRKLRQRMDVGASRLRRVFAGAGERGG